MLHVLIYQAVLCGVALLLNECKLGESLNLNQIVFQGSQFLPRSGARPATLPSLRLNRGSLCPQPSSGDESQRWPPPRTHLMVWPDRGAQTAHRPRLRAEPSATGAASREGAGAPVPGCASRLSAGWTGSRTRPTRLGVCPSQSRRKQSLSESRSYDQQKNVYPEGGRPMPSPSSSPSEHFSWFTHPCHLR